MVTRLEDRGLKKKAKFADKIIENRLPFSILSASQICRSHRGRPPLGPGLTALRPKEADRRVLRGDCTPEKLGLSNLYVFDSGKNPSGITENQSL
jgi:hypothetical protein